MNRVGSPPATALAVPLDYGHSTTLADSEMIMELICWNAFLASRATYLSTWSELRRIRIVGSAVWADAEAFRVMSALRTERDDHFPYPREQAGGVG